MNLTLNKKTIIYGLIASIGLQLAVLLMEYGGAVYPLVTGQEVKLKVIPIDPRSLFRGNYARLNYEISNVSVSNKDDSRKPRQNEFVYVKLKQDEEGFFVADGATLDKPDEGLFIRGRNSRPSANRARLRFGIEAYFAPKERALQLEKDLRNGGVAVIMLASNGKATLKDVIAKSN